MKISLLFLTTATISATVWAAPPPIENAPLHVMDAPPRYGHQGQYQPTHFAWSPDGRTLATGAENAALYFWDVKTGKRLPGLERSLDSVYDIAYSPDGRYFAVGTSKLVGVSLWDARTGKLVKTFKEPYPLSKGGHIADFAFAPDGKTLYVANGKDTQIWDVASGKLKRKTPVPEGVCGCGWVVSPDGKRVAGAKTDWKDNGDKPSETLLYVWNLQTGKVEAKRQNIGWPLAWSNDGTRLYTRLVKGADDNRIGHWFVNKDVFRRVSRDEITANGDANPFDLSNDGKSLAVGQQDGSISVRGARHGELLQTLRADKGMITGLSFSPDGSILASGGDKLKLWRVAR